MSRIGKYTIKLDNQPVILNYAAVVGRREGEGPLAGYFDTIYEDTTLGEKTWERAESALQRDAITRVLAKAHLSPSEIQYLFAGDLLNQCIATTFGLREYNIPLYGQFGACSTMAQTLSVSSIFVDGGAADLCAAITSSHFCTAERQFRQPLEYGGQRPPTAQWTATAAGALIVGNKDKYCTNHETLGKKDEDLGLDDKPKTKRVVVNMVTAGYINDLGIIDASNMGAAMAPAAAETLNCFFDDTETEPNDYDLIITGDLAKVGGDLLRQLMEMKGHPLGDNYTDCGLLIYDRKTQDVHSGASGCGCSAAVVCSYLLGKMEVGELNNVLFVGTGALMSPTSSQQGDSIPGIAHLVNLVTIDR